MIRLLQTAIFLTFFASQSLAAADFSTVRRTFHQAVFHPDKLAEFLDVISSLDVSETPLIKAYAAGAMALQARESWNPYQKASFLSKYRNLISEAISEDMGNLEIRFLRYSIEFNIPKILRSDKKMAEDKKWILRGLNTIDHFEIEQYFVIYIIELIKDTKDWSTYELNLIREKILE